MYYSLMGLAAIIIFFSSMLACIALGQRLGKSNQAAGGLNVTEGAVFTLMALLDAFTFSSANQRFDFRRTLIIEETNAISTAYLRLDIFKSADRIKLQKDFLDYISSRIAIYKAVPDFKAVAAELQKSKHLQEKIWQDAVAACSHSAISSAPILILTPINSMFDIASTRTAYTYFHPHILIFVLLVAVALLSALLTGYGMSDKGKWLSVHILAYTLIITLTIYIIIDLEYPRLGVIKEAKYDYLLEDLKNDFSKIPNESHLL